MSYTVLAVKWRPKRFEELIGQPHVVQALVNSLAAERLHHAYLFSGTRGVGKTTVARILAKALNCEQGVVAEPCGKCSSCIAIDEGRFVDLIEVDAASRTRVDDTRELLDNVQYAPTNGRYKVYLIDEVHMLSNHSFNALLKTLEEPPPHVKFLLATTDPQKLPITVLSRCLQFHLKKLTRSQIQDQLAKICSAETVEFDDDGLRALAVAADGSMRDALSLLDQSIAFGNGTIASDRVNAMLGSIDRDHVHRLIEALSVGDGSALIAQVAALEELAADYGSVLDQLMSALQQIAVVQLVDGAPVDDENQELVSYASKLTPEDVQLYYQIALNGRRDLAVCRDARMGFEMTLLRMLAFRPDAPELRRADASSAPSTPTRARRPKRAEVETPKRAPKAPPATKQRKSAEQAPSAKRPVAAAAPEPDDAPQAAPASQTISEAAFRDWSALLAASDVRGMARQLGDHCEVKSATKSRLNLILTADKEHLNVERLRQRLEQGLTSHLGNAIKVSLELGKPPRATPAEIRVANENEKMRQARQAIEQDSNIHAVQAAFDAVVEADTIQPIDKTNEA